MKRLTVIASISLLAACAQNGKVDFGSLGSSLLSTAGISGPSSSSINSLVDAGSKISKAARGLTDEQEYYLGRGVAAIILSKYHVVGNDALNRYVTKVGRSVAIF